MQKKGEGQFDTNLVVPKPPQSQQLQDDNITFQEVGYTASNNICDDEKENFSLDISKSTVNVKNTTGDFAS